MRSLLPLVCCLFVACGSEPPPAPPKEQPRQPTVLDDQIRAMDKAKAVEEQEMERKRKMDEQLEGGG